MERTYDEHMAWCKRRALAYLPDSPQNAWNSMVSDLGKHPETANHSAIQLGMMLMMAGHLNDAAKMREFIEGFR